MATPPTRGSGSASSGNSEPGRALALVIPAHAGIQLQEDSGMNQAQGGRRRGIGLGGIRWWVLLLFAGYAVFYWISNRSTDPLTGETVLIDKSISPEDEKALGLQAW